MADEEVEEAKPKKKSKLPMLLGVVLAIAGGAGGFLYTSVFFGGSAEPGAEVADAQEPAAPPLADTDGDVAFVPLAPMIVSLGAGAQSHHLRFAANLEVPTSARSDVEHLLPRVTDALHSFLRSLDESDVEDHESFLRLRTLMLHRVRLVLGEDRVTDLLDSEFVLN